MAQTVKRLSTMLETWVRSLGREDPLEKEMANHASTVAWEIPWTEVPVGYSPWGCKESDTTERLHFHFHKTILFLLNCEKQNFLAGRFSVYSSTIFLGSVTL